MRKPMTPRERREIWEITITAIVVLILLGIYGAGLVEKSEPQIEVHPVEQIIGKNDKSDKGTAEDDGHAEEDRRTTEEIQKNRETPKKQIPRVLPNHIRMA